jgi:hypothetical protein
MKKTLQGIIIVNDFDSKGNPIRYALLTDDERKYLVEAGRKKPELKFHRYNRKKVRLSGHMRVDGKKNIMAVDDIMVIKNIPETSATDLFS